MILELLKYLTTPCNAAVRKAGYLTEAVAIASRSSRLKEAWRPHLENSKRAIKEAAAALTQRRRVCIIGSGLHLDLPLEFLSATFESVHLVDIVHLRSAVKNAKRYSNTVLHHHDVTGVVATLQSSMDNGSLPPQKASLPECCREADLVVSLNLLSQLPLLPESHLEKSGAFSAEKISGWSGALISNHLGLLREHSGSTLLLADVERTIFERETGTTEKEDPLYGVTPGIPLENWEWETAPEGEIARHVRVTTRVGLFDSSCFTPA